MPQLCFILYTPSLKTLTVCVAECLLRGTCFPVQSSENSVITLRGSTDIIVEFFQYAITCILYQRGIYPAEDFDRISKYGLVLHVAKEEGLVTYLKSVLNQLKGRHTFLSALKVAVSLCPTSFWSFVLLRAKGLRMRLSFPVLMCGTLLTLRLCVSCMGQIG